MRPETADQRDMRLVRRAMVLMHMTGLRANDAWARAVAEDDARGVA